MAAIFGPRANTFYRVVLALLLSAPAAALAGLMLLARSPLATEQYRPLSQPIPFDHRHHAKDEGIDCRYCHDTVETSPSAGIPDTSTCMNCHAQVWNETPALAPVRDAWFSGAPILWQRVHRLPDHVYFDHAIHVNKGVGCVTCHGRVDLMARVEMVTDLSMGWCLDCHRAPASRLRPRARVTDMTWRPAGDPVALGEALIRQYDIRTRTNCTTCHR